MSGEYPTKSLDAMTVLSEAATALREVRRPVSTGSSFVEKKCHRSLFAPLSRQLPV